ncbi:MAG: hypothetical protein H6747_09940 [Deltaproteobacteria bacterium]|nr:hypothetical protein [Deltaproteobacteria bacterium]
MIHLRTLVLLLCLPSLCWAGSGCPDGARRKVRHRGKERACVLKDGTLHGPWRRSFRLSRDIGQYDHGVRVGRWRTELFTGERHEFGYAAGKLDGPMRKLDAKGKVMEQGGYRDGKPHGRWRGWWPDRRMRYEGRYDAGARVGRWRHFYADGTLREQARYVAGAEHGPFERRWPGGAPFEAGAFFRGARDGSWRALQANGRKLYTGEWTRGRQVGTWTFYDEAGAPAQRWNPGSVSAPAATP